MSEGTKEVVVTVGVRAARGLERFVRSLTERILGERRELAERWAAAWKDDGGEPPPLCQGCWSPAKVPSPGDVHLCQECIDETNGPDGPG